MYDSVYMRFDTDEPVYKNFENTRLAQDKLGYPVYKGFLNNMRLCQNYTGISIAGSLPKLIYGNNVDILSRQDTKRAIEFLSDSLHIPVRKANVYSLEIAHCFMMKYPVSYYLNGLGDIRYFKNMAVDNQTRVYLNNSKSLKFYDKLAEMIHKKAFIPDIYHGKHILRYEVKLNKRVSKTFKLQEVIAETLSSETFYIQAIDLWENFYSKIEKKKSFAIREINLMKDVRKFKDQLAVIGLQKLGVDKVKKMLEQERNDLTRIQYSRLQTMVKDLSNAEEFTEPLETIQELDDKVRQVVSYYR